MASLRLHYSPSRIHSTNVSRPRQVAFFAGKFFARDPCRQTSVLYNATLRGSSDKWREGRIVLDDSLTSRRSVYVNLLDIMSSFPSKYVFLVHIGRCVYGNRNRKVKTVSRLRLFRHLGPLRDRKLKIEIADLLRQGPFFFIRDGLSE